MSNFGISSFDYDFNQNGAHKYVNFSTIDELNSKGLKILFDLWTAQNENDHDFLYTKNQRDILKRLVETVLFGTQTETYDTELASVKLLDLFKASNELLSLYDLNSKKKFVYSKIKQHNYNKEIDRYSRYENIPIEFARLSNEKDCIKYLVGFFLRKHININFNADIIDSCKAISLSLMENPNLLTPYTRTAELQKYLHELCRQYKGSELEIPSKIMRIILSTARLHFIILDDKNLSPDDLLIVINKQNRAVELEDKCGYREYISGESIPSKLNKKYFKNWRKRHLMPFLPETLEFDYLASLNELDSMLYVKLSILASRLLTVSQLKTFNFTDDK